MIWRKGAESVNKKNTAPSLWQRMKSYYASYILMCPFLLIFITFNVIPVLIAIFFSLTQFNMIQSPIWVGFENYRNLFLNDALFLTSFKNTLLFASITGPVSYLLCLTLAWLINELSPKVRALVTLLFYAPSLASIFYIWQLIFSGDSNGFLNSWLIKIGLMSQPVQWLTDTSYLVPVVIFVLLWGSIGTSFLAFIAGLQNVDRSLYEAGAVDGITNRWQELWYITLPSIRGMLMFGAIMSITSSFSIGPTIDVICGNPSTDYAAWTLMNHLTDYGTVRFEMGYACTIATLLFIVMVALNQVIQKLLSKVGS
jgi:multiple sugar transport system permease protein